jgi:hypothetical protein
VAHRNDTATNWWLDGEYQRCGVLNVVGKEGREMINPAFAMQRMKKLEYVKVCDTYKYTIRII